MKRRTFIQQAGLLAGGLVIAGWHTATASVEENRKIKGFIRSGKKGLSGVVVSDGYSVVLTNNAGKYEIRPSIPMPLLFLFQLPQVMHFHRNAVLPAITSW